MIIRKVNEKIWDAIIAEVGKFQDTLTGVGGLSQSLVDSSGSGGWPEASFSLQEGYSANIYSYVNDADRPSTATNNQWDTI